MRLLLTGCAGFIGHKVAHLLLDRGDEVVGIDNLNDAYDVRLKEWRLGQLEPHPRFRFHRVDIAHLSALEPLFQDGDGGPPFDAVLNLGARAGVRQSVEDPWAYYETNTLGALNLLELCRRYGVPKFVQASTSSVYGADTPRPFREDADTSRPLSPYAASKKAAEALAYTYHHLYDLDVTVLRYFTVYGPAGRPDMSVFRFVRAIAEGEPITIYGDGRQERDFTFVEDIARGTVAALRPLGYAVINLGSDRPVVLMDLVRLIERNLGRRAVVRYQSRHAADVMATWAHIGRARELLDWAPRFGIEEGLDLTVRWYMENRSWAKDVR